MTIAEGRATLRIMPREMRMMTERILSLTGLPSGFLLQLNDYVMYSQKLGLGGFAHLEQRLELLKQADPADVVIEQEEGPKLVLDCGGQHGWIAMPAIVNLLGELAAAHGHARIQLRNIADVVETRIVEAVASRIGLAASLEEKRGVVVAQWLGASDSGADILVDLLQNGVSIPGETWSRIYELAKKALAPDSVVSRRHAGPLIVTDDGSVIGRTDNDDETDVGFLLQAHGTPARSQS